MEHKKVDPIKSREYSKKYYDANKAARSEKALAYYYLNKDRILQRMTDDRKDPTKMQAKIQDDLVNMQKHLNNFF